MSDNLVLGRGIVYLNRYNASGELLGERDIGNCPELSYNVALSKLEHFNSRSGLKSKDKEVITQITPSLKFTVDEISIENFNMMSLGTSSTITQTAATDFTETINAKLGYRVDLDKRAISNLVVKDSTDTTTYVSGTDYLVDTSKKDDIIGRIYFPEGSSITDDEELNLTYDYGDVTYTLIKGLADTSFEAQLRFVSDNPVGPQIEFTAWKVNITVDGDTSFIGDDWSKLSFTGEILKDEANHSSNPYFQVIRLSS